MLKELRFFSKLQKCLFFLFMKVQFLIKFFIMIILWVFYHLFFYEVGFCVCVCIHACSLINTYRLLTWALKAFPWDICILKAGWKWFRSKRSEDVTFFLFLWMGVQLCFATLSECSGLSLSPAMWHSECSIGIQHKPHWALNISHCYSSHLFSIFETAFQHCSNHFLILNNFQFRDFLQFPSSERNPIENLFKDI